MKLATLLTFTALSLTLSAVTAEAFSGAKPGGKAPAFEAPDATGKIHKLSDYTGRWLVLEWYNVECPYVVKHYDSGNMQKLQKEYRAKGAAWLSVNSAAPGKQGHHDAKQAAAVFKEKKSQADAVLLDPDGKMGKAYGAKTTPHMYVINPKGEVVYAGAIDDNDSANPAVIASSRNHVREALDEAMAGKPVTVSSTRAYGCAVKY